MHNRFTPLSRLFMLLFVVVTVMDGAVDAQPSSPPSVDEIFERCRMNLRSINSFELHLREDEGNWLDLWYDRGKWRAELTTNVDRSRGVTLMSAFDGRKYQMHYPADGEIAFSDSPVFHSMPLLHEPACLAAFNWLDRAGDGFVWNELQSHELWDATLPFAQQPVVDGVADAHTWIVRIAPENTQVQSLVTFNPQKGWLPVKHERQLASGETTSRLSVTDIVEVATESGTAYFPLGHKRIRFNRNGVVDRNINGIVDRATASVNKAIDQSVFTISVAADVQPVDVDSLPEIRPTLKQSSPSNPWAAVKVAALSILLLGTFVGVLRFVKFARSQKGFQ